MRNSAVILSAALILSACGNGTSASSTAAGASTSLVTVQSTTSTSDAAVSGFSVAAYGVFPDPLVDPAGAHGSGCSSGSGDLGDGIWFGYVENVSAETVTFNPACVFTGPAAVEAAVADGQEALDFYIRDEEPESVVVSLDLTGLAYWLDGAGDLTPQAIKMLDWPIVGGTAYQACPGVRCAAWLYINGGVATELLEQYLP